MRLEHKHQELVAIVVLLLLACFSSITTNSVNASSDGDAKSKERNVNLDKELAIYVKRGDSRYSDQRYDKAIEFYKKAYTVWGKIAKPDPQESQHLLSMMSRCYRHLKKFAEAQELGLQALEASEMNYGRNSESYALNLRNMGLLSLDTKKWNESKAYLNQSLAIMKALYGDSDHLVKQLQSFVREVDIEEARDRDRNSK